MSEENSKVEQDELDNVSPVISTDEDDSVTQTQSSNTTRKEPRNLTKLVIVASILALGIIALVIGYPEYHITKTQSALREHNLKLARKHVDSLRAFPFTNKAQINFLTARLERRRGDYDKMNQFLEEAQAAGFDPVMIQRERILAAAQTANLELAESRLPDLLNDPRGDEREICEAYIIGYLQFQQHDAALQLADAWQNDFPEDARPHFLEGVIQKSLFNHKLAEEAYRRALEIDPEYYQAAARHRRRITNIERYRTSDSIPEDG